MSAALIQPEVAATGATSPRAPETTGPTSSPGGPLLGAFGQAQFNDVADEAAKQQVYAFEHELLGGFEVFVNVGEGLHVEASAEAVTLVSPAGISIRSRAGLPSIIVYRARLAASGAIEIDAEPDIGPFEEDVLSTILRATVLKHTSFAQVLADLPTTRGGDAILQDERLYDVTVSRAVHVTTDLSSRRLRLGFSPPIFIDVLGALFPLNLHLGALTYDFATATLDLETGAKRRFGRFVERLAMLPIVEKAGRMFLAEVMPPDMQAAGYDPTTDPDLGDHLATLVANITQAGEAAPQVETTVRPHAPTATAPASARPHVAPSNAPADDAAASAPSKVLPAGADEAHARVLYQLRVGGSELALAMEPDDALTYVKRDQQVELSTTCGLFLMAAEAPEAQYHRIFHLAYDFETGKLHVEASRPLGAWTLALLEKLVRGAVAQAPPSALGGLGIGPLAPVAPAGRELLCQANLRGGQVLRVSTAAGDPVALARGEDTLTLTAAGGLRVEMLSLGWMPYAELRRIEINTRTGQVRLESTSEDHRAGALTEALLSGAAWLGLAPIFPELAPPELPPAEAHMLFETEGNKGQRVDISTPLGDAVHLAVGRHGLTLRSSGGVLVRVHKLGVAVRLFALDVNFDTDEVTAHTNPPTSSLEHAIATAAYREFAKQHVAGALATYDDKPGDKEAVLYRGEVAGWGSLAVCMADDERLVVEQDGAGLTITTQNGSGIYWKRTGKLAQLLPATKLTRIGVDYESGRVSIDGGKDPGPFLEEIATRVLQAQVLPRLPADLRSKVFGGADPLQVAAGSKMPGRGQIVLHQGELGELPFDISLSNGWFELSSVPGGLLHANPGGKGLLFRMPSLGLALSLAHFTYNPKTGVFTELATDPPLGGFELDLVTRLAKAYVLPLLQGVMPSARAQADAAAAHERVVMEYDDIRLLVDAGDTLALTHSDTETVLSASQGMRLRGSHLGPMPVIYKLSYTHKTGAVAIEAAQSFAADGALSAKTLAESAALIEAVVRRLLEPHVSPMTKAFGIAAAGKNKPLVVNYSITPWYDGEVPTLGRLVIPAHSNDSVSMVAGINGMLLNVTPSLELHFVDLGIIRKIAGLNYIDATGEVIFEGLNPLEASLLTGVAPLIFHKFSPGTKRAGAVAATFDSLPHTATGDVSFALPVDPETGDSGGNLAFAWHTMFTIAMRRGTELALTFTPPLRLESTANFTISGLTYRLDTGEFSMDADGEWIGEIFEYKLRNKVKAALVDMLPAAMKQPGYNFITDPKRLETLAALRARVGGS